MSPFPRRGLIARWGTEQWRRPLACRAYLGAAAPLYGSRVVTSGANIITLGIVTRGLGVTQFGMYGLIVTSVMFVRQIFDARSQDIVARYLPRALATGEGTDARYVLQLGAIIELAVATLGATGTLIAAPWIARLVLHDAGGQSLVRLGALIIVANTGASLSRGVLGILEKYAILSLADASLALAVLGGTLIAGRIGPNIEHFLLAFALGSFIPTLFLSWTALKSIRSNLPAAGRSSISRGERAGMLRFVLGANLLGTLRLVQTNGPTLILGAALDPHSAGVYYLGIRVAGYLNSAVAPLLLVARNKISVATGASAFSAITIAVRRSGLIILAIVLPVLVVFSAAGGHVLSSLFGTSFAIAALPASIILLGMGLGLVTTPLGYATILVGSIRMVNLLTFAATAVQLTILFLLMGSMNSAGAAIAYSAYYVVLGAAQAYYWSVLKGRLGSGLGAASVRPHGSIAAS